MTEMKKIGDHDDRDQRQRRAGCGWRSARRSTGSPAISAMRISVQAQDGSGFTLNSDCDRALQVAADQQQQAGEQDGHPAVVEPAGRGADPLAEPAGHVVVQRPGRVDLLGVARHDPAEREHADRGDQHRQRRGDAAALAGGADHADDQRDHEGRGEHRAHEPDRLRDHIGERQHLGPQALVRPDSELAIGSSSFIMTVIGDPWRGRVRRSPEHPPRVAGEDRGGVGLRQAERLDVGDRVGDDRGAAERHVGAEQHVIGAEELHRAPDRVAGAEHRGVGVEAPEVVHRLGASGPAMMRVPVGVLQRRCQAPGEMRHHRPGVVGDHPQAGIAVEAARVHQPGHARPTSRTASRATTRCRTPSGFSAG